MAAQEISVRKAILAFSATACREKTNRIPFFYVADSFPNFCHGTRSVGSQDAGQKTIYACLPLTIPDVPVVQGRSLKTNDNLCRRSQMGFFNILVAKFVCPTMLVDPNSFQAASEKISFSG